MLGAEGLEKADFSVFRPVKLMLAQTAQNVTDALAKQGGVSTFEYKYDGARVQIHKKTELLRFLAKDLVTSQTVCQKL
jgi:DNA ligase 1